MAIADEFVLDGGGFGQLAPGFSGATLSNGLLEGAVVNEGAAATSTSRDGEEESTLLPLDGKGLLAAVVSSTVSGVGEEEDL